VNLTFFKKEAALGDLIAEDHEVSARAHSLQLKDVEVDVVNIHEAVFDRLIVTSKVRGMLSRV
jgi:hypothetical protein